jgi:hypothetical protein
LLNSNKVQYLLVGGYAVGYYGYPRATGDMDIWIAVDNDNAEKTSKTLIEFGMSQNEVTKELFLEHNKIIRIGFPPVRIEIITGASGISFQDCYNRKKIVVIDDIEINIISLNDLKINKQASARHKDLEDLEHLP